jgi:hypothetical protein
MNITATSQFVTLWAIVNVGAILVLAVMSYFSSIWILDGLEALDRWLYRWQYVRQSDCAADNALDSRDDETKA